MNKPDLRDRLNRPIHDLRISVIDRCNFRCTYCMPEQEYAKHYRFLDPEEWLTFDEILRVTEAFVRLGVEKVRITGGEPLIRRNVPELIHRMTKIRGIQDLALTTNGSLLAKYAYDLKKAGLNRLTISLDTLNTRIFKKISGHKGSVEEILEGIERAQEAGFDKIKINVVIQKGVNDGSIIDMVRYFKGTPHVLRFIEYMDVGNCNHWDMRYVVPTEEIIGIIHREFPLEPLDPGYFGEVAQRYKFKDGKGEIGFVSSVTKPFCGSCTRARLSTEGKIYTCLFAGEGSDVRSLLRNSASDDELAERITEIWKQREDRYSEIRSSIKPSRKPSHKVEMFQIGG